VQSLDHRLEGDPPSSWADLGDDLVFDLANPLPEYRSRRPSASGIARLNPVGFGQNYRDVGEIVVIQRKLSTTCLHTRIGVVLQGVPRVVVLENQGKALHLTASHLSDHGSAASQTEMKQLHPVARGGVGVQKPFDPVRDLGMTVDGCRPTTMAVRQQHSFLRAHRRILGSGNCRTLNRDTL